LAQQSAIRLAICVPSLGSWAADFGLSLARMCCWMAGNPFVKGEQHYADFFEKRGSNLPRNRQESLEDAILKDCTHALFLDTDQSFPHDTAHRLFNAHKVCVAANIPCKTIPAFPTARLRSATPFGTPIGSMGKTGLERVWRIGCGVMMVDLNAVMRMPKPWFEIRYDAACGSFLGEDWFFCQQLEAAGHEIYVDHDLSRQVGHMGDYLYTHLNIPPEEVKEAA
jgi:hypothetical protein